LPNYFGATPRPQDRAQRKPKLFSSEYESVDHPIGGSADLMVGAPGVSPLPNLNFEKRIVEVFMAPLEVLLPLAPLHFVEIVIILVLLLEIGAVGTILAVVPGRVVVTLLIVIAFFGVACVLRPHYDGTYQCGAEHQRAQD
jgi:hypothetical protein